MMQASELYFDITGEKPRSGRPSLTEKTKRKQTTEMKSCDICGVKYLESNKTDHLGSKKHRGAVFQQRVKEKQKLYKKETKRSDIKLFTLNDINHCGAVLLSVITFLLTVWNCYQLSN